MAKEYYTVAEVAEIFSVHERTVRSWIKDGTLRAIQIKREYRIPVAAVKEIQQSGEMEASLVAANY